MFRISGASDAGVGHASRPCRGAYFSPAYEVLIKITDGVPAEPLDFLARWQMAEFSGRAIACRFPPIIRVREIFAF